MIQGTPSTRTNSGSNDDIVVDGQTGIGSLPGHDPARDQEGRDNDERNVAAGIDVGILALKRGDGETARVWQWRPAYIRRWLRHGRGAEVVVRTWGGFVDA